MNWFYAVQGQQVGPVDQARLEELVRSGVIKEDTLVWHEGMDGWKPYAQVRGVQNINLPTPAPSVRYGGFWIRFVADIIDGCILGAVGALIWVPMFLIFGIGGGMLDAIDAPDAAAAAAVPAFFGLIMLAVVLVLGIQVFYNVYFLTRKQATPGKMALGLKVIRADGQPGITTGLAVGRFFAEILTGMTFYIGYIIAGFDDQKRSLHDHICSTRVIYAK